MNQQFIKPLAHVSKQPVSVERIHPDRILIEGVLFDGDYFREIGYPKTDVLYMVRKDVDGCVCLTVIRDELEARQFFEAQGGDCFSAKNKDAARNDIGEQEYAV